MAAVLCAQLSSLRISAQRVSVPVRINTRLQLLGAPRSGWEARLQGAQSLELPKLHLA